MKKTDSKIKKPIRIIFVVIVVVAIVLLYCIGPMAYVFAETRNGIDIWSGGAAVYIDESNSFVWDYNGDAQFDPDSLTMLLTCLISAEELDAEETVTVPSSAISQDDRRKWLKEGEEITVDALMHLALMESDAAAGRTLAITVSESEEEFVKLMNERAIELGCTKSQFYNATGQNNTDNCSSAKDICIIAEAAMQNSEVGKVLRELTYDLPATNMNEARTLSSSNLLMTGGVTKNPSGQDVKVEANPKVFAGMKSITIGQKTVGFSVAEINGVSAITAVLEGLQGSEFGDMTRMTAYAEGIVQPYKALEKGTVFETKAKVKNGAVNKVSGEAGKDGYVNLLEGASASLILVEPEFFEEVTAPIAKGDVIGKAVIYLADVPVSSVDIVAMDDVKEGWIFSRIGIPNSVALIIMIVLVVIIALLTTLSVMISRNKARARARRNERIKEIAMKQLEQEQSARERDWPYRH